MREGEEERRERAQTNGVCWAVEQVDARKESHIVAVDNPRRVSVQRHACHDLLEALPGEREVLENRRVVPDAGLLGAGGQTALQVLIISADQIPKPGVTGEDDTRGTYMTAIPGLPLARCSVT